MLARQLLDHWPLSAWQHRRLLVGVSGGADSVGLLCALRELAEPDRIVAAHYNHGWRGDASNADESFVVHLCRLLQVECVVGHAAPLAQVNKPSAPDQDQIDSPSCVNLAMLANTDAIDSESNFRAVKSEELAREARYRFFIQSAYEYGAGYVLTAHTADDRVETLLHNLFRGSGLSGAASLTMYRRLDEDLVLARPLIAKWRSDVLQYLSARGQSYCNDASNSDLNYARNYIRHHLLPAVRTRYAEADANLLNFSQLTEEGLDDIRRLAQRWLASTQLEWETRISSLAHPTGSALAAWREQKFWVGSAAAAAEPPWTVVREALRLVWLERAWPLGDMSRRHWQTLREWIALTAALSPADPQRNQRRQLGILPGSLVVESAFGYIALGRLTSSI